MLCRFEIRVSATPAMSPAIAVLRDENEESQYQNGVKRLHENGISKVPSKYILPVLERPSNTNQQQANVSKNNLKLPIIDFQELQGPNRPQVIQSLANACEQYGFFQVSLVHVHDHSSVKFVLRGEV